MDGNFPSPFASFFTFVHRIHYVSVRFVGRLILGVVCRLRGVWNVCLPEGDLDAFRIATLIVEFFFAMNAVRPAGLSFGSLLGLGIFGL